MLDRVDMLRLFLDTWVKETLEMLCWLYVYVRGCINHHLKMSLTLKNG